MFLARCLVAVAVVAFPALASAQAPQPVHAKAKPTRTARVEKADKDRAAPRTCTKPAVEVMAGSETATFSLTRCDGTTPAPLAVDHLSILARPGSAAKPRAAVEELAKGKGADVAPGIRRVDPRLLERLELAVEHFSKSGGAKTAKVQLISGVRPKSAGSYHQSGRALDFRIDGVTNEALVAFCKTLDDTGCGYYPNSLFVHMDVRNRGAGHVAWIDVSKPGETPKYVSSWPLPKDETQAPKEPNDAADTPAASIALPALPAEETDARDGAHKRSRRPFFF
jgi:hypothetical protein